MPQKDFGEELPYKGKAKILLLIELLKGGRWTVRQLRERLDASHTSMYRYLRLLEEMEVPVDKDHHDRYFIVPDIAPTSAYESTAEKFLAPEMVSRAEIITRAIQHRHRVLIKNYHSASSQHISDREVEPIHVDATSKTLVAFDVKTKATKRYKLDRMEDVEEKHTRFQFEEMHDMKPGDPFGFAGPDIARVRVKMTERACVFLRSEFPLAAMYTRRLKRDHYMFEGPVSSFVPVARFILGLPGDAVAVGPKELKDFLTDKMKNFGKIV